MDFHNNREPPSKRTRLCAFVQVSPVIADSSHQLSCVFTVLSGMPRALLIKPLSLYWEAQILESNYWFVTT